MTPIILITRPAPANAQFADQVRARIGDRYPILMSPLMRIEFSNKPLDLARTNTLIFTSRNGVRAYARATDNRDIPCYCVGDATTRAARNEGLTAISCGGAAENLIARIVSDAVTGPCLHIRGAHAIGDIASRLTSLGIPTQELVLYTQVQEAMTMEASTALRGKTPIVLPLFSPRTARLLLEDQGITAPLRIAALSQNVADVWPSAYAETILVAERPDVDAMLDAVETLIGQGKALETGNLAQ